jgi:membrane-associated phospholipid phosphatase
VSERLFYWALLGVGSLAAQMLPVPPAIATDILITASSATALGDTAPAGPEQPNPQDARDRVYYPGDTESVAPLFRKLGTNILLDQKEIWTSPFHMRRGDAKWWLGFGAVTAGLIATDHRTINTFENGRTQVKWANNISKIGAVYTLIPAAAGFYAFGVILDDPKARETGILGGEAMIDTVIVSQVLKTVARRRRPNSSKEPGHFFDGGASFPSGHAIASWSLASVVAHEYQHTIIVPIIAYGLAAVVSTARFGAQQHYASDIVAGAAMGWFIGRYVYQTHEDHQGHRHGWLQPKIIPMVEPSNRAFGIGLVFSGT